MLCLLNLLQHQVYEWSNKAIIFRKIIYIKVVIVFHLLKLIYY